jgi:cysteine desulfurase
MKRVYLDNAATTPLDPAVIAEMTNVMQNFYGNPSAIHALGTRSKNFGGKGQKNRFGIVKCFSI